MRGGQNQGWSNSSGDRKSTWEEIPFTTALRKVKQALRDAGAKASMEASSKPVGNGRQSPKMSKMTPRAELLEPIPWEQLGSLCLSPGFGALLSGGPPKGTDVLPWQLASGLNHSCNTSYQGKGSAIDDSGALPVSPPIGIQFRYNSTQSMLPSKGQTIVGQQHSHPQEPSLVPSYSTPLPATTEQQGKTISLDIGMNSMESSYVQQPPLSTNETFANLGVLPWSPRFSHEGHSCTKLGRAGTTHSSLLQEGAPEQLTTYSCLKGRSCWEEDRMSCCRLPGEDVDSDALSYDDLTPLPL